MKKKAKKEGHKKLSSAGDPLTEESGARQPLSGIGRSISTEPELPPLGTGHTTRKTIEVPEDFFYRVKRRALDRRMKEKELWAEILYEYFTAHPTV
jgi:hypothetical protein